MTFEQSTNASFSRIWHWTVYTGNLEHICLRNQCLVTVVLGVVYKLSYLLADVCRLSGLPPESADLLPAGPYSFEIRVETDVRHVYRGLQRLMSDYKNEKRGPTFIAVHSCQGYWNLLTCWRLLILVSRVLKGSLAVTWKGLFFSPNIGCYSSLHFSSLFFSLIFAWFCAIEFLRICYMYDCTLSYLWLFLFALSQISSGLLRACQQLLTFHWFQCTFLKSKTFCLKC